MSYRESIPVAVVTFLHPMILRSINDYSRAGPIVAWEIKEKGHTAIDYLTDDHAE